MAPKISVIVPCYNQSHFLPDAIASLQAQEFADWECIVVNDGSTDGTEDVTNQLSKLDNRIRYSKKQNGGLGSARNQGLDLVRGAFIQFLDADDKLVPEKFSASLSQGGNADIILTDFRFFTNSEAEIAPPFRLSSIALDFNSILTGWDEKFVIPVHCGLFRCELFANLRFNEMLKAREDWVMWLQLFADRDITTTFIDHPLAFYRLSPSGMSQNKAVMNQALLQAYGLIYPLVPDEVKTEFFNQVLRNMEAMILNAEHELSKTRSSRSYRLGNLLIRGLKGVSLKKFG